MLSEREISIAFEIAEQLIVRTEIKGVDIHKHIESVIGKYGIRYNNKSKFQEFEKFVLDSASKKIVEKRKRKEQSKMINRVFVKDIYSGKIEGFKNQLEASRYLGLKTKELNSHLNKKILDKKFVIVDSYSNINIFEAIEIEYREIHLKLENGKKKKEAKENKINIKDKKNVKKIKKDAVKETKLKISNIFTKEECEFEKQIEVANYLNVTTACVSNALKLGSKIKREWAIEKVC